MSFALADVVIVDDNGTPGDTSDDFSTTSGDIVFDESNDDDDGILSPGETWTYTASAIAQDLSGGTVGSAITFDFSGSTPLDGEDGNIRTFSADGISVNASAFSRDKCSGGWSPAYLGAYWGGLGVTDSIEGGGYNNTHTVDNVCRDNYVLFEFSESVVVDSAFLGYVVCDSDMSVWIGTIPDAYGSHGTLSDTVLSDLGFTEVNETTSSSTRTADLNAGQVAGNVLVIAAWTGDATPEDRFKIQNVTIEKIKEGCYENKAVVTADGVSAEDLSHYCNPDEEPGIDIEKLVRGDTVHVPPDGCLCADFGKPKVLTMLYTGDNVESHLQATDKVTITGDPSFDPEVYIVASDKADPSDDHAKIFFQGEVDLAATFAIDATAAGETTLKANTYVHIFDTVSSTEALQTIQFHTSCSQPLYLGDQFGGIMLVGFLNESGDGASSSDLPPNDFGEDADSPTGPLLTVGDAVTWTYVVTNPGTVPLANVVVSDDQGVVPVAVDTDDDTFIDGDTNKDRLLDPNEIWIYTATGTVVAGQYANTGTVTASDLNGKEVSDDDPSHYLGVLPKVFVCKTGEKPQILTMLYTGDGDDATDHLQDPSKVTVTGDPNDAAVVYVIASDKADPNDSHANIFFEGEVELGDTFPISATYAGQSKLKAETFVLIFGVDLSSGDPLLEEPLQTVRFHTSCSQPLVLGDQFGGVQLVGFLGDGGAELGVQDPRSSIHGIVWDDANEDDKISNGEQAIEGVQIRLTGTDDHGKAVDLIMATDEDGVYMFTNLRPSDASGYTIIEEFQPVGFDDGVEVLGKVFMENGEPAEEKQFGVIDGNDKFSGIVLKPGEDGEDYNFAEHQSETGGEFVTARQTATIGFWQNRKGQALIKSLNSGPNGTELSAWLVETFPNMYGEESGDNNLTGKTNAEVAKFYKDMFKRHKRRGHRRMDALKLDPQAMAVALAIYVTDQDLAGTVAQDYGFTTSATGVGGSSFDIDAAVGAGTAEKLFGDGEASVQSVLEIMRMTNDRTFQGLLFDLDGSGRISGGEKVLRSLANDLFAAINEAGDIH